MYIYTVRLKLYNKICKSERGSKTSYHRYVITYIVSLTLAGNLIWGKDWSSKIKLEGDGKAI